MNTSYNFPYTRICARAGSLEACIYDQYKNNFSSARIQLKGSDGEFYYPEECHPYEKDNHFTVDGYFQISLPEGKTSITIEKGKEYHAVSDEFLIESGQNHKVEYILRRWINMASINWYSGDLHVHRSLKEISHLMRAEDINAVPLITVWNRKNLWDKRKIPTKIVKLDDAGE